MLSVKTKYANGRDYFTIEYCMFAEEKLHPFTTFSIHDATQKSTLDQTLNLFIYNWLDVKPVSELNRLSKRVIDRSLCVRARACVSRVRAWSREPPLR